MKMSLATSYFSQKETGSVQSPFWFLTFVLPLVVILKSCNRFMWRNNIYISGERCQNILGFLSNLFSLTVRTRKDHGFAVKEGNTHVGIHKPRNFH